MPNDPPDLDEQLNKRDTKLKEEWNAQFDSFKADYKVKSDSQSEIRGVWEKRLNEAVSNMNTAVERSSRLLENNRFNYQILFSVTGFVLTLIGFVGVAGTVFGVQQYFKFVELSNQIEKQSEKLKKREANLSLASVQISNGNKTELQDRVHATLEQTYADLDNTMESISSIEPSEELLLHLRLLDLDKSRITSVMLQLQDSKAEEASLGSLAILDSKKDEDTASLSEAIKKEKDLDNRLDLDRTRLELVADAIALVDRTRSFIRQKPPDPLLLTELSRGWTRLYDRIKQFPEKSEQLGHLAGYCQETLGSIGGFGPTP